MKSRRHAVIVAGVVALVLLVPALIWSGMRATDAATREAEIKLPEVSTVGPEMIPYVLTPAEREKLKLPAFWSPIPLDYVSKPEPKPVVGSQAPYPGMTQAELDKLAAWQARLREQAESGVPQAAQAPRERQPVSTIELVPRAPGIEGMTPAERAKLEAYLKERK